MEIRKKKGFTLIELLIAIAVIGILMSLLIPAVSKVMESARRTKGANCLAQIAKAYNQYMNDDVNGRTIAYDENGIQESGWDDYAKSGIEFAIVLARRGYLNDPNMYVFSGDSVATRVQQKSIVENGKVSATTTEAWGTDSSKVEFSVYVIAGIPSDAPLSTTPIAFTRGIPDTTTGKWSNESKGDNVKGVYGDKGGYIAYLDGHVEWYEDLGGTTDTNPGKLIAWGGTGTTNDILKTIPSTAYVLSATKEVKAGTGDTTTSEG